jgi:hypothetical protein
MVGSAVSVQIEVATPGIEDDNEGRMSRSLEV